METFEDFVEKEYTFRSADALREFTRHLEVSKIPFTVFGNTVVNVPPTTVLVYGKYTIDGTYKYLIEKYSLWHNLKRKANGVRNSISNIFNPRMLILVAIFFIAFVGSKVSTMGPIEKLKFFTGDVSQLVAEREKEDEKNNTMDRIFNRGEDASPFRFTIGDVNITIGATPTPTPTPEPQPEGIIGKIKSFISEE